MCAWALSAMCAWLYESRIICWYVLSTCATIHAQHCMQKIWFDYPNGFYNIPLVKHDRIIAAKKTPFELTCFQVQEV